MAAFADRIAKHARINWKNLSIPETPSPPFLILFINSICNMKCEHCFYWKELNQKTDLTFEEIVALSNELGPIEHLNLSGGEPFLRKEFGAVCRQFIQQNGVKEIYTPTNGYFTERTVNAVREVLKEKGFDILGIEISLDGMPEFHDAFRKSRFAFSKAMETYDALVEIQKEDPRLQIYAISTATQTNMPDLKKLTTFLYDRCPKMSHHHLAIIRGERKDPSLQGPVLQEYKELYQYMRRLWGAREEGRQGSAVEPMLQYVKTRTAEEERQIVPCRAGVLSAVIHANGDVALCEQRPPIGNLRDKSFKELWHAHTTCQVRKSIKKKECYCTNEIFMWPSIVFQPTHLAKTLVGAKVWEKADPLPEAEKVDYAEDAAKMEIPPAKAKKEVREVQAEWEERADAI